MNFSGNLNLLALKGAKVFSGLDQKHPQMNFVCIPVGYNDIVLSADGKRADVGVYMAETSDKYRQACIQRRQMSGEDMTDYNPPSHTVEVSFSREFRERAMEAARKRIVGEHPEWQTNEDLQKPEFNRDLKNAMYDAVRVRLGSLYARVRQQQATMQTAAPAAAGQPSAWQPPQVDPLTGQPVQSAYDPTEDDLPF